jgi:hypothetical protein
MSIEFMTGATLFALINFIIFLLTAYLTYRGGKKLYAQYVNEAKISSVPREFVVVVFLAVLFVFFSSSTQPKVTIDTKPNAALIEYQRQNPEIVIETPAPRTETLQGFEPLKQ